MSRLAAKYLPTTKYLQRSYPRLAQSMTTRPPVPRHPLTIPEYFRPRSEGISYNSSFKAGLNLRKFSTSGTDQSKNGLTDRIIGSITRNDSSELFAILISHGNIDAIPEGLFGPAGVYSVHEMHQFLHSNMEKINEIINFRSIDFDEKKQLFKMLLNYGNSPLQKNFMPVFRIFDKIAMESDVNETFQLLVDCQIDNSCNARSLIASLIQSRTISQDQIGRALSESLRNNDIGLMNLIQFSNAISRLNNEIIKIRVSNNLHPADNKLFLTKFVSHIDAETELRILIDITKENSDGKKLKMPEEINTKKIDKSLAFFVKFPEALDMIKKAERALWEKDHERFTAGLLEIDDIQSGALKEFLNNPITLQGRLFSSLVIERGDEKFLQILLDFGLQINKWNKSSLIFPESSYLISAISAKNPNLVRFLLNNNVAIDANHHDGWYLKDPLRHAIEVNIKSPCPETIEAINIISEAQYAKKTQTITRPASDIRPDRVHGSHKKIDNDNGKKSPEK